MAEATPAREVRPAPRTGAAVVLASCCAFALFVFCARTPASADHIGPHWDAAKIVAEHPGTTEILVATYKRVGTGNQRGLQTVVLGIAEDYGYTDDGARRLIVDAKLRRVIAIDLASGSFRHDSIYSVAGFMHYEAWNRIMLGKMLRQAGGAEGAPPSMLDTFWIESDVGRIIEDQPRPSIEVIANDGSMAFSYGGNEVATVEFSDRTLSDGQRDRLRNLLRLLTKLHPDILEKVVAAGKLPHTLAFRMPWDPDVSATTYTLESARSEVTFFPLTAATERGFAGDHGFYADIQPIMEAAVTGSWASGPKKPDDYFAEIRDAANQKAWFKALLLQTELSLFIADQSGGCTRELESAGRCTNLLGSSGDLLDDERVKAYVQAQEMQRSDPVRAVEIWRGIPLDDVPNPYLMGVFVGNVVSAHGNAFKTAPVDPYEMFAAAVAANPYVSSFYKDLGDHFRRELRFDLAWICYDLGRALPNRPMGDVLEHVDVMENQLRQQVPQFF